MSSGITSINSQDNINSSKSNLGIVYKFDRFRLDAVRLMLYENGQPISLAPKVIETLLALVERHGEVISKDELMNRLWGDSFVEESNLTQNIYLLRKTLGNGADGKPLIETFRRRGYRFTGNIEKEAEAISDGELKPIESAQYLTSNEIIQSELANKDLSEFIDDKKDSLEIEKETSVNELPPAEKIFWNRRNKFLTIASIIIAATAVIAYLTLISKNQETGIDISDKTLAVLPFKILDADTKNDYLSVGLADSLITKLSNVRNLAVRPTSSVLRYTNLSDTASAGRELKVETVVDGAVQQIDDRVRVTVRLVRVADGKSLWANTYDAKFVNIFQVEDEISARIAQALKIQLDSNEQARLAKRPTENIEAYRLCLRANYHLYKLAPDDLKQAFRFYNEAIALDNNYALAYAGLAYTYQISHSYGDKQALILSEIAATKAIELDPTLSEAHTALAAIQFWNKHDVNKAQTGFNQALELNPNSAIGHQYYGWVLTAIGQFDEAEKHLHRALELDPLSMSINSDQGLPFFFSRRYNEARAIYTRALELDANQWYTHLGIGEACEAVGDTACAVSELSRADTLSNGVSDVKALLARTIALVGRKDEAHRILNKLTEKNNPQYVSFYFIALAYIALNEPDKAFENLERAITEKDSWVGWAKVDPRLDAIRSDARFSDFMHRINLQ